ncbi:hypothetical protein LTR86_004010 [Recurvomyces mirabilis]|nr:hypothetical protein LTR86_004010 [Recurvomyces mirabilis]
MAFNASKLIPSDPEKVTITRNLAPTIKIFSSPFLRVGRIKVGGRGTIVQLASGNLAVFSPVALTDAVKSEVAAFGNGQIKYITALDKEHHIFLEPWHKAFPDAVVIGPEPLLESREKQGYSNFTKDVWRVFPINAEGKAAFTISEEFDREFEYETLIEADLMFNLPATEQFSRTGVSATSGVLTRIVNAINTTHGSAIWQKRLLWYALSASDRTGFNRSMGKIAGWDFDRIVPCHGDVIEKGGKGVFEKVFSWHLEALKKGK